MTIKLAVMSDLHCHSSTDKLRDSFLLTDRSRSPEGEHPVESLLSLIEREGLTAHCLVAPGDLTNRVSPQGLISGWQFVQEVGRKLNARMIAATLGNHDVNSHSEPSDDPLRLARDLDPKNFPTTSPNGRSNFWSDGYYFLEDSDLGLHVLVISSVLRHHNPREAKRGEVTKHQLDSIRSALSALELHPHRIAVTHHHPIQHEEVGLGAEDLMVNGSLLVEVLEEYGFSLLIHGHKHHPRIRLAATETSPIVVFAAGSLAACSPQMLSNSRNLFHLIDLETTFVPDSMGPGRVRTWEFNFTRGWSVPAARSSSFAHEIGFGCRWSQTDLQSALTEFLETNRNRLVSWEEICESLPQVRYVMPRLLHKVVRLLNEEIGLRVFPAPPELTEAVFLPVKES